MPCISRVVVLDFDGTLFCGSISSTDVRVLKADDRRKKFFEQGAFLTRFIPAVRRRHHKLCIASFAERSCDDPTVQEDIQLMLDSILPEGRDYLIDPLTEFACWQANNGKNAHIEWLLQQAVLRQEGDFEARHVVLVDDSAENVEAAQQRGFHAFHCPNGLCSTWYKSQWRLQILLGVRWQDVQ